MKDILFDHDALRQLRSRDIVAGSRSIRLATTEVNWIEYGDQNAPLPIVVLSGQWLGAASLVSLGSALGPKRRVLLIDLPGHGLAAPFADGDYSANAYADFIANALVALDLTGAVLVGHSHSGIPAAIVAAQMPDRIAGLVLATASGMPRDRTKPPGLSAPVDPDVPWYETRLAELMLREHDPGMRRTLAERTCAENAITGRASETAARSQAFDPDLFARVLPRVGAPSLVLWSSDSTYLPTTMADQVAALLPDCRGCHIIPDTGHLLLADAPVDVAQHLDKFMESLR